MEATEFMIGDWILAHNRPTQLKYVAPFNLRGRSMIVLEMEFEEYIRQQGGWDDGFILEDCTGIINIAPIPLTEEILEHNFADTDDGVSWKQNGDWYEVEIVNDAENEKLRRKFRYVHEFQHALRLAGIDKEIEL